MTKAKSISSELNELYAEFQSSVDADLFKKALQTYHLSLFLEALPKWGLLAYFLGGFSSPLLPLLLFIATVLLAISKILNAMELGHNIMHGQWDSFNHPYIHSLRFEWEVWASASHWKHHHNKNHHPWVNILDQDRDLGWGLIRVNKAQAWQSFHRWQWLYCLLIALFFQASLVSQDLEHDFSRDGPLKRSQLLKIFRQKKMWLIIAKEYLLWPAMGYLSGGLRGMMAMTFIHFFANMIRNIWAFLITFVGHFPLDTPIYQRESLLAEPMDEYYRRQINSSVNIRGGAILNLLSGHLSFQIEHHLFPDLPAVLYPQLSPKLREICRRHQLEYRSASLGKLWLKLSWQLLTLSRSSQLKIHQSC